MLREELLKELQEQFTDNPLFKDNVEAPECFVSAYHFTRRRYLKNIGKDGILPTMQIYKNPEKAQKYQGSINHQLDQIFDSIAPSGWSRANSVYAHDNYHFAPHLGNGDLVLEIKVDPEKCLVADAEHFIVARACFEKRGATSGLEKKYWDNSMSLNNFTKLPIEEKTKIAHLPEILIPGKVEPSFVRVKGIFI